MGKETGKNNSIGLYIHIPFCRSKCHYCDFNSHAGIENKIAGYMEMLKREADLYSERLKDDYISSIFIGGGTPSLTQPDEIASLMKSCKDNFNITADAEITIEGNPGTLDKHRLETYLNSGINRLSMGLQAWQDGLLKRIGRIHTLNEFLDNLQGAREIGFHNINVDLMLGLPEQTLIEWKETINNIIELKLPHLSCYSLKVEEGTRFYEEHAKERLILPDEEIEREMYEYAVKSLKEAGYLHYEISNFALEGFECGHNLLYWTCGRYIGLGTGAHSYYAEKRYNNVIDIEKYNESVKNNVLPIEQGEIQSITREESMKEFMLLGLRMMKGVGAEDFKIRYGMKMMDIFGDEVKELIEKELVEWKGSNICLTRRGLDLANEVFVMFV